MATKKYVSLSKLSSFLDKLKTTFASLTHTHSYDDLRNKPFYEGTDYSSILTNGTSTVNFYEWGGGVYGAAVTDAPQVLKQDISHKVIWDGTEYTMTCTYGGNNEFGNPITCLGAPYGDYSNYPFGIDSYQTASGTYEFSIHTNSTSSTHAIDILELGSSFVTLDDRFISDNIARTIDVDTAIDSVNSALSGKANANHTHSIGNVTNLQSSLDGKVPTSRTVNGKALSSNITLSASDVGAANSSHSHDDRYYTETEMDSKLSGKANTSHTHSISNVTNLQSTLDGKSNVDHSHTTHTEKSMSNTDLNTIKTAGWYYGYTGMTNAPAQTIAVMEVLKYSPDWIVQRFIVVNGAEYIRHWHSGTTWSSWKTNVDSGNIGTQSVNYANSAGKATQDGNGKVISSTYETKTDASSKLTEAKTYADNAANAVKNDLLNGAGSAYDTLKELGNLIDDNADAIDALETVAAGKADKSHTHAISDVTNLQSTLDGKAAKSHGTHVTYSTTAPVMDGTASVGTASTVARSDHKHPTDTSRASQADLDALESVVAGKANSSHTHTIANITNLQSTLDGKAASSHNHSATNITSGTLSSDRLPTVPIAKGGTGATTAAAALTNLGVTATAAELNKLDGVTATTAELNYVDGVTSNIQTQLNGKSSTSHTHSAAGSSLGFVKTGGDVTISDGVITVNDDSHNHTIANIDNLQTTLNGKEDIISWSAIAQGQTWSRICLVKANTSVVGWSGILSVGFTRGNVVGNATFVINASHSSTVCITQLNANKYTSFQIRGVTDSNANNTYIEIYDSANSIASGTNQTVYCKFIPVLGCTVTKYTSFTTGASIPSGYTAGSVLTVDTSGGSMVASKFVGNLSGNATSATKATQDGSGNTITSTYATKTELNGKANTSHTHTPTSVGGIPIVTTAGTGSAYTATIDGITALTDGLRITIIPHTASTTIYCTLNVNGLGAKTIFRRRFDNTGRVYQGSQPWLMGNMPITLTYSATFGSWMADFTAANSTDINGIIDVRTGGTGTNSLTKNYFLVGNGTNPMVEKSPSEVLSMINGASVAAITTAEYEALGDDEINTNTLYMLTDAEEEVIPQIQIITWEADD